MIESLTFRVELELALAFVRDPNETPETLRSNDKSGSNQHLVTYKWVMGSSP